MPRSQRLEAIVALLVILAFAAGTISASEIDDDFVLDDDFVILELQLGGRQLGEDLVGSLRDGGVLLPLGELLRAFELPITVDPGTGTAQGWFVAENRRFALDLKRQEVLIEGRPAVFEDGWIEARDDDLYVDHRLFSRWFPIDLELDLTRLRLLAETREALPLEARLERRRRQARLRPRNMDHRTRFAAEPLPYRVIDWPLLDSRLDFVAEWPPEGEPRQRNVFYALATGDFLKMNAELAVRLMEEDQQPGLAELEDERLRSLRLRLERTDYEGGLLGPLRATRVAVGDLNTPERSLISREHEARGFEISSFPPDLPREFDHTTLSGRALPGWEVELYRNGDLVDFQIVGADGRYEFREVRLLYGFNYFRFELYGPHGERRHRDERFLIGPELIRRGANHFRFTVHRNEHHREPRRSGELETDDIDGATGVRESSGRYLLELERGLTRKVSLRTGISSFHLDDGRHTYADLGFRGVGGGLFAALDLVADQRGGAAVRLAAQTRYRRAYFRFEHDRSWGLVSEELENRDDPLLSRSSLQLESSFASGARSPLTLRLTGRSEQRAAGTSLALAASVAARWRRLALTESLSFHQTPAGRRAGGELRLSHSSTRLALRGQIRYELMPRAEVRDLALTTDWRFARQRSLRVRLRHGLDQVPASRLEAELSWHLDRFALGVNGTVADDGGMTVGMSLSASFGRDPFSGRWRSRPESIASHGAAAARVFLDRDLDGRFDPGRDEALTGVRLRSGAGGAGARTDEHGVALLTGLPVHEPLDLNLALGSLEDPYWIPTREGIGLIARPGRMAAFELPIVASGEIDGTVYLERDGKRRAVSEVELELLGSDGTLVRKCSTAYDGFYLLDRVPPGRYDLRVAPGQLARLGLIAQPARRVALASGEIASIDFVLTPDPPADRTVN